MYMRQNAHGCLNDCMFSCPVHAGMLIIDKRAWHRGRKEGTLVLYIFKNRNSFYSSDMFCI